MSANEKKERMLSRLDSISVRELQSAEIARQFIHRDVDDTVDPVLLVDRDAWNQVAAKENKEGKYIFVYSVSLSALSKAFADQLSKQTGLKIVYSSGDPRSVMKQGVNSTQTPDRWLQLIRDAEYVVTDSFHGTAFSTLFQKNFFTVVKGDPGEGFNIRMNNFLTGIGLESRLFSKVPGKGIDCTAPDYTSAESLLAEKINFSRDFLKKNLEAAYRKKLEGEEETKR